MTPQNNFGWAKLKKLIAKVIKLFTFPMVYLKKSKKNHKILAVVIEAFFKKFT